MNNKEINFNELVTVENNEPVTSSKQVAEVFGKNHYDVMKDIRKLIAMLSKDDTEDFPSPQTERFEETTYTNKQNKQQPMYIMNRDAFTLLVMGYTTKNALKFKRMYIQAFNLMEQQLKNQIVLPSYQIDDPVKRAERWIEEEKERQRLANDNQKKTKYITDNKERTKLGKAIEHTQGNITIGSVAKILKGNGINIGQNRLFKWMRNNGYLISKKGRNFNDPTQKSMELELFKVKENSYTDKNNVSHVTKTTLVTGKGQKYFVNLFLEDDIDF